MKKKEKLDIKKIWDMAKRKKNLGYEKMKETIWDVDKRKKSAIQLK